MTLKQLLLVILFLFIALSDGVGAESSTDSNRTEFHSYIGLNSEYTEILAKPAGWFTLQYGFNVSESFNLGMQATGLYYEHTMDEVVETGAYKMEGGYVGIFVEYHTDITEDLMLGLKYTTGRGLVKYELEKEYRKDKFWYERIVDQDDFVVNILAAELSYNITSQWWIGFTISYKLTSPIELHLTDEFLLNTITGGLTLRYQLN